MNPHEIVPRLADQGIYLASESTFYRIRRRLYALKGKENGKGHLMKKPTTYSADGPCQVWTWDITYMKGPIAGVFFYLYLIIDIYSRFIVGWEVWENQSADNASTLMRRACNAQGRLSTQPLVLHSDNGSAMKGAIMLATLEELGIIPSFSRPRVSNDNPYSESQFKTLKYCRSYPKNGFATIEEAREWVNGFVHLYNYEHLHSGINYVTPADRHYGRDKEILAHRQEVYEKAKAEHPERWNNRKIRDWNPVGIVTLNPERVDREADALVWKAEEVQRA